MTEWKWYYGPGADPEDCQGPEDTRAAAIEAARDYYDGETFTVLEARKGTLAKYLPCADDVIEQMLERAYDNGAFGEDGDPDLLGKPEAVKSAEEDLTRVLREWFGRHAAIFPAPWVFAETRNAETFNAAQAEAGARDEA